MTSFSSEKQPNGTFVEDEIETDLQTKIISNDWLNVAGAVAIIDESVSEDNLANDSRNESTAEKHPEKHRTAVPVEGEIELQRIDSTISEIDKLPSPKIDQNPIKLAPTTNDNRRDPNLCRDSILWIRVLLIVLSLFLFFLCSSYSIGQLLETKLDVYTTCPEPKTREEIWAHSYQKSLQNGEVVINEESQFGWHDESCWTTRKVEHRMRID